MLPINASKLFNRQLWVVNGIYLVFLGFSVDKLGWGDDAYYSEVANTQPLLEWWWQRYLSWSGRVTIDVLTVGTITSEWFWRIAIPSSVLLLAYASIKVVKWKVTPMKLLLIFGLFAVGPAEVFAESFYWVTGFYNYLLPTALALFCYSELHNTEGRSIWRLVFSVLCVFIFAYQEQVVIAFILALGWSTYHKPTPMKWLVFFLTLVNSVFLFFAPGNESRMLGSTFMYFPNYYDFNIVQKVFLGLDKLYQAFVLSDNWPLFYLLSTLVFVSLLKEHRSLSEKASAYLVILYLVFFILQLQLSANLDTQLAHMKYVGEIRFESVPDGATYAGYLVLLLVMSSALTLILGLLNNTKGSGAALMSLLLGVMSVVMMGFSPTVYVSNYRVQMLFELGLILATLSLLRGIDWCKLHERLLCSKF